MEVDGWGWLRQEDWGEPAGLVKTLGSKMKNVQQVKTTHSLSQSGTSCAIITTTQQARAALMNIHCVPIMLDYKDS